MRYCRAAFDANAIANNHLSNTGNGACETACVEAFENLRPAGSPWRKLVWVALFAPIASLVAWLCLPVRFK